MPFKVKIPPSGIIVLKKNGEKLKIKTNQTNYLTYLIFWDGYTNFEYTTIFQSLIKKVNVFYDIGANIGYYSLLAEFENPSIKVVSFEPAIGPLFYLNENVLINNFKNIKTEGLALSHTSGEIEFFEIKNHKYSYLKHNLGGEGNAGSKVTGRNFKSVMVKTLTLDEYVVLNDEVQIDLIKMDTEGTEDLILEHAETVLRIMKPIIICETIFNKIETKLEAILLQYGYEFYNHNEYGLFKVPSIIRDQDNGISNCFFVHPSKKSLIEEYIIT
ncbi:MAG: FkbM family methyltransferase [Bacteroidetes bacterium]|nr:FkbM family methyltransferase [Bacteroidota bacterium]